MATEVLLMADVPEVGTEGQVVMVADGFARNYLLPRKMAAPVTAVARAQLARMQKDREARSQLQLAAARELAAKLKEVSCTMTVKTGDKERMYGSVGVADIAASLKEQGFDVDRHSLLLEAPLKELGVYDVKIKLHPEVEATVKVWVVEE